PTRRASDLPSPCRAAGSNVSGSLVSAASAAAAPSASSVSAASGPGAGSAASRPPSSHHKAPTMPRTSSSTPTATPVLRVVPATVPLVLAGGESAHRWLLCPAQLLHGVRGGT